MSNPGLRWSNQGTTYVLADRGAISAPNRVVLRSGEAQFWERCGNGYNWSALVKCPYSDIKEAKVWAKREYLLNYAGD